MKVTKTGPVKSTGSAQKAKKSNDDGAFADALRDASGAGDVDSPVATSSVGPVESILAAQQSADPTEHRSRGLLLSHGNDLLDRLDQLRMAILNGVVPKERLQDIAKRLRERKISSDDPKLNEIIEEIELRVEVEIAKLTR